ncbi:MAG: hypothetical protein ACOY94_10370 [Bacillota bacterium]
MALTDNCDVFVSAHEDGFNRIVQHVQQQRPSLFHYATKFFADRPDLLCEVIKAHEIVKKRSNPLVTVVDPLPVPGSNFGVNFAAQLVELKIDFHPGNQFTLPPEFAPPLGEQRFALKLKLCGGIGCPSQDLIEELIPPPAAQKLPPLTHVPPTNEGPIVVIDTRSLTCFCLEVFVAGHFETRTYGAKPYLEMRLDGLEIVDIKPNGLENSLECYIKLMIQLVVLPQLRTLLEAYTLDLPDWVPATISLGATAISGAVPHNPAVEKDQVRLFIDVGVS